MWLWSTLGTVSTNVYISYRFVATVLHFSCNFEMVCLALFSMKFEAELKIYMNNKVSVLISPTEKVLQENNPKLIFKKSHATSKFRKWMYMNKFSKDHEIWCCENWSILKEKSLAQGLPSHEKYISLFLGLYLNWYLCPH